MFGLVPLRWERGYQTCWRGELRAQPEPRTQSARESTAKPEIERGEGSGEGLGEPLPRKISKIHT